MVLDFYTLSGIHIRRKGRILIRIAFVLVIGYKSREGRILIRISFVLVNGYTSSA